MKYKCSVSLLCENPKELITLFEPEPRQGSRASFKLTSSARSVRFEIQANDVVALRAIANSIFKLLAVWEAANKLENGTTKRSTGKD